jgi:hypothetical protein
MRRLRCAIEQLVDWSADLFVEPHVVAFVAVASRYSDPPAVFAVACEGFSSRWLRGANDFEVSWHQDTLQKAKRLRSTMQSGPLVELAAISVALILSQRVVNLGSLDVTALGERADFVPENARPFWMSVGPPNGAGPAPSPPAPFPEGEGRELHAQHDGNPCHNRV